MKINTKRIKDILDDTGVAYYDMGHYRYVVVSEFYDVGDYDINIFYRQAWQSRSQVQGIDTLCAVMRDISGDLRLWRKGDYYDILT